MGNTSWKIHLYFGRENKKVSKYILNDNLKIFIYLSNCFVVSLGLFVTRSIKLNGRKNEQ